MNYIFTIVVVTIIVLSLVTGGGNLLLCLLLLLWIFELQLNMSLNHTLLPKNMVSIIIYHYNSAKVMMICIPIIHGSFFVTIIEYNDITWYEIQFGSP